MHRLAQAGGEDVDLLTLHQRPSAAEQRKKLLTVVRHRAGALEGRQCPEWVAPHRWPELGVDELNEVEPGRLVDLMFNVVVLHLCRTIHVEQSKPYLVDLWCLLATDAMLAVVEPW